MENGKNFPKILSDSSIYLPDFSYAGYHHGEVNIPNLVETINVIDYGAIPNDGNDDTESINIAIKEAGKYSGTTVLKFPSGRFILSSILFIEKSNFVLQGSGTSPNGTTLFFTTPLKDLPLPKEMEELDQYLVKNKKIDKKSGRGFSPFSWTGGLIWVGKRDTRPRAYLTEYDKKHIKLSSVRDGKRGYKKFYGNNLNTVVNNLTNGNNLAKLLWFNRNGKESSLLRHMYGDHDIFIGSHHWNYPERPLIEQIVTIKEMNNDLITIKEPLLHDLNSEWGTILVPVNLLREVGIERMRIEFPKTNYGGHHLEDGYNAIYINGIVNSWIKDVKIINSDNAFISDDCAFISVENFEVIGRAGHYGLHFGKSNHMLANNVLIDSPMLHSISANTKAKSNVFHNIEILQKPTIDQHCGSNHQNLFDNIKVKLNEENFNLFKHGGAGYWKPTHGMFNTFWNVELDFHFSNPTIDTLTVKGVNNGPNAYIYGLYSNKFPVTIDYGPDAYKESINERPVIVKSLYKYQLEKRINN